MLLKQITYFCMFILALIYTNLSLAANNKESKMLNIQVGNTSLEAVFADTKAASQLHELLATKNLTVAVEGYGGFEIVGELPSALTRSDSYQKAQAGDIMLYQGRYIVIFYGTNSYSYTKLGQIVNASKASLQNNLEGTNKITLSLK